MIYAGRNARIRTMKNASHSIAGNISPIERRTQHNSGYAVRDAQCFHQPEVLQDFYKTGKKKDIKRHPRNPRRQKDTYKAIYQHYHQHISDIRSYETVAHIQSYQHLHTEDHQKADYIKNSFLHYLLGRGIKHLFESANIR